MTTAVSSSSPLSMLTPGAAAQGAQPGSPTTAVATGTAPETSDFNSVLSPLMAPDSVAGSVTPPLPMGTETGLVLPAELVADAPVALIEGLNFSAVIQQSAAIKGNPIPASGNGLPENGLPAVGSQVKGLPASGGLLPGGEPLAIDELALEDLSLQAVLSGQSDTGAAVPQDQSAADLSDGGKQDDDVVAVGAILPSMLPLQLNTELAIGADQSAGPELSETAPVLVEAVNMQPDAQVLIAATADTATMASAAALAALAIPPPPSRPMTLANSSASDSSIVGQALPGTQSDTTLAPAIEELPEHLLTVPASDSANLDIDGGNVGGSTGIRSADFARLLEQGTSVGVGSDAKDAGSAAASAMGVMKSLNATVAWRMDGQNPVATTLVQQPVDSPQWTNEIGERVAWFGANNIHLAEIELDPPELGPLQVRISTQNDQTTVTFTSHHAAVREVLDQNMSRLKEMFSEQGLNLVQADVGERRGSAHEQQPGAAEAAADGESGGDGDADAAAGANTPVVSHISRGLVDAYA